MMIDPDDIFRYKIPNGDALRRYGFCDNGSGLQKQIPILKEQFDFIVTVAPDGKIDYKVIDNGLGEEYMPLKVKDAQGSFVGEVRAACAEALADIAQKCFDTETVKAEQTKRIIEWISNKWCVCPEFLWEKNPDCAAFRRKDNAKWFAVIMSIDRSKLKPGTNGNVEIIDLKADPARVEELIRQKEFYPAYHMNKKHWFTVCLDGSVEDSMLFALVAESYMSAAGK